MALLGSFISLASADLPGDVTHHTHHISLFATIIKSINFLMSDFFFLEAMQKSVEVFRVRHISTDPPCICEPCLVTSKFKL